MSVAGAVATSDPTDTAAGLIVNGFTMTGELAKGAGAVGVLDTLDCTERTDAIGNPSLDRRAGRFAAAAAFWAAARPAALRRKISYTAPSESDTTNRLPFGPVRMSV